MGECEKGSLCREAGEEQMLKYLQIVRQKWFTLEVQPQNQLHLNGAQ